MLNIKDIRSNPEIFIQNLKKRNIEDSKKIINNEPQMKYTTIATTNKKKKSKSIKI